MKQLSPIVQTHLDFEAVGVLLNKTEMDENYEKIREYFSDTDWEDLGDYEKNRYLNVYNNYLECREIGLDVGPPDFITARQRALENQRKGKKARQQKGDEAFAAKVKKFRSDSGTLRRNPKREATNKEVSYKEDNVLPDDKYIYCDICNEVFEEYCRNCGKMLNLIDNKIRKGSRNRARLTVPKNSLEVKQSPIHGLGVFASRRIPIGIRMGPYEGQITKVEVENGYAWSLKQGKLVDAYDETKSNWMRYVNCSRNSNEQNLVAFQYNGDLYYRSCKDIEVGEELLVFYGSKFAENLGIDLGNYFIPEVESKIDDVYACYECCFGFSSKEFLDKHKLRCRFSNVKFVPDGVFRCRFCKVTYSQQAFVDEHEKNCRKRFDYLKSEADSDKVFKYNCDKCSYGSNIKGSLKHHQVFHSKEKKFVCDICKQTFNYRHDLNRHVKVKHSSIGVKLYFCDKCKYSTVYSSDLKRHERIHSKLYPFVCSTCNKGFNQKFNLENHLYNCLNLEKPYKCKSCTYSTNIEPDLNKHIKSIHLKLKEFKCDKCPFKTYWKSALKTHSFTHSSSKPFKCIFCEFQCCQNGELKRHIQKHRSHIEK